MLQQPSWQLKAAPNPQMSPLHKAQRARALSCFFKKVSTRKSACKLGGTSAKLWSPSQLLGQESRSAPGPHVAASNGCTFLPQNTANQRAFLYLIISFNCVIDQGKVLQCWLRMEYLPSFFVPTTRHLAAQVSLPLGICHPRQKNTNAWGLTRGGGGRAGMCAPGIDWNWGQA